MATGNPSKRRGKTLESAYSLVYPGKVSESEVLSGERAPLLTIAQTPGATVSRLIFGDNLLALRGMLDDPLVQGKVDLIYIDPPYATGSQFSSRTLDHAYEDVLSGAQYLEFLRQRLIVMRELLSPRGSIYVHLDDKMAFPAKVLMDEVFGPGNFRNWITRQKCNPKNFTRKQYGNVSDYILFYTKSSEYIWNRPTEALSEAAARSEYRYVEPETGRRFMKVPIHAPGVRNGATGGEWRGMKPPPGKHWQYTPATLDAMDARGEIYWSATGNPRKKVYLDEHSGVSAQDLWLDFRDANNQMARITGYPTEKNASLLMRVVLASSEPGSLVLDGFAGSGTTPVAAEELGRPWIAIDNSPLAITTILRRLAHGSERMGDYVAESVTRRVDSGETVPLFGVGLRPNSGLVLQRVNQPGLPRVPAQSLKEWERLVLEAANQATPA